MSSSFANAAWATLTSRRTSSVGGGGGGWARVIALPRDCCTAVTACRAVGMNANVACVDVAGVDVAGVDVAGVDVAIEIEEDGAVDAVDEEGVEVASKGVSPASGEQ